MKKCSTSLAIKEMQIKTTLRFPFTTVKMAIINNTNNNKCGQRCLKKETLLHFWWKCKSVQLLWKDIWRFFKTKNRDTKWFSDTTPRQISEGRCSGIWWSHLQTSLFWLFLVLNEILIEQQIFCQSS
jgi:hypothetical protein